MLQRHLWLREPYPVGALVIGLALIYVLYTPGLTGGFYYDDVDQLTPLASLESLESYLHYVFAGETGPLGRPLAMATLLLHLSDWPEHTEQIFRVNVLIHLINGLLLVWLCLALLEQAAPELPRQRRTWIAVSTGLMWLGLPLLVSTSLIAIQRMTSLSATFSLLGLVVYLKTLGTPPAHTQQRLVLPLLGLAVCTALAALAKENGLLLPVYALVLELTLLRPADAADPKRRLRLGLLALYALAILAFVLSHLFFPERYAFRDFTLIERLQTQPLVLWQYLGQAFLPRTLWLSPFHDSYPKVGSLVDSPAALLAIAAWVAVLFFAVIRRTRWRFFSLAVFWFLAGHLLESTALPLELYFEHRNYLPLVGPCLALVWISLHAPANLARVLPVALGVYIAMLWALLYQTTSLWGDQRLAAEIWHTLNPASPRAAMQLAAYQANELGDGLAAIRAFDTTSAACPHCLGTRLMGLKLACLLETPDQIAHRLQDIRASAHRAQAGPAPVVFLGQIIDVKQEGGCQSIPYEALEQLNHQLLALPAFNHWNGLVRGLQFNQYRLARQRGDRNAALSAMRAAWQAAPGLDIVAVLVADLIEQQQYGEAISFLDTALNRAPTNPIVKWLWSRELEAQRQRVLAAQAHTQA